MHRILIAVGLLVCTAIVHAADKDSPAQQIADAYHIAGWDQIEELNFTFNVDLGARTVQRQWTWNVKTGDVMLRRLKGGDLTPITYNRHAVHADSPESVIEADKQFINDSYWLLFPFQIVWSDPTVTDAGTAPLPIGSGKARKVVVQYSADGGYTPGDAYDLYLRDDGKIHQWMYRKGGGREGRAATWEQHHNLGPIVVCLEHWGNDHKFHLQFTNVSAKLVDQEQPVTPTSNADL